jgi:hypothetical protein
MAEAMQEIFMANDGMVVATGWLSMAEHGCRAVLWLFLLS